MVGTTTRKLIVGAITALLAAPAMAAEPRTSLSEYLSGGATHINNSRGRKVEVVRGGPKLAQLADPFPEELADPPAPEPDDWQGPDDAPASGLLTPPAGPAACGGAGGCGSCGSCGPGPCGCNGVHPFWAHRSFLYGEYLYLVPTDADMAHAFQQNGVGGPGTVPDGAVGVVQPDFTSAYRTGFGFAVGCNATIGAHYSRLDSFETNTLAQPPGIGGNVQSLVLHPNSINAGSTASLVNAQLAIDYQLADIEYRRLLSANYRRAINFSVGVRYGKLQQDFLQVGDFAPPTGTIQTTSDITFEGVGLRAGLDGERRLGCTGFSGYSKGYINILFGEFQSSYQQLNTTTTEVQAFSTWIDRRTLPLLEYEVGISWLSRSGRWRATFGYYTSFWFNTITTGQLIQAVQNADFVDVGETIAFNGLVTRAEFRF